MFSFQYALPGFTWSRPNAVTRHNGSAAVRSGGTSIYRLAFESNSPPMLQ